MRTSRRTFLKSSVLAASGYALPRAGRLEQQAATTIALFDGKTLNGWIQIQNSATSFSGNDIADLGSLATRITTGSDAVSAFLKANLNETVKSDLSAYSPQNSDAKALKSALAKELSKMIASTSIYENARFQNIRLRPETESLQEEQNLHGRDLLRCNRLLLEDAFPRELAKSPSSGWIVKDGAMASIGAGRGVIYTDRDYSRYRLMFTMRHVSGDPDHQACILIFCSRPLQDEVPLDALGGIQFQVPKGGHWDYRQGHSTAGGDEFTTITKPNYDPHEWSRVELLVDSSTGSARMAVAQPVGSSAVEVLDFRDPNAGKVGPIGKCTTLAFSTNIRMSRLKSVLRTMS